MIIETWVVLQEIGALLAGVGTVGLQAVRVVNGQLDHLSKMVLHERGNKERLR